MGHKYRKCVSLTASLQGAELDQVQTAADVEQNGPLWTEGALAEFDTEYGPVTGKYVRNQGAAAVLYGRTMYEARVSCTVRRAYNNTTTDTAWFQTTYQPGHPNQYVGCIALVANDGNAAPEGQSATVISNTSATTNSQFNLDRSFTTPHAAGCTMNIIGTGRYVQAVFVADVVSRSPGVVVATSLPALGMGWVVTKGVYPKVFCATDNITLATLAGGTCGTNAAQHARTTNMMTKPVSMAAQTVAGSTHWPMKVGSFGA